MSFLLPCSIISKSNYIWFQLETRGECPTGFKPSISVTLAIQPFHQKLTPVKDEHMCYNLGILELLFAYIIND